MRFILGIVVCLFLGFLFYLTGHIATKKLNLDEEDNELFSSLIKICLGISTFLIIVNLTSSLLHDFNLGLIIASIIFVGIILWQLKDLKDFCRHNTFIKSLKTHMDKYSWILFGIINFIYAIIAFSTTKIEHFGFANSHIDNVTQLINGIYPPKYSFLSTVDLRYHYGSDILAATISKLSGLHPEFSFDWLSICFLNLALFTLLCLAKKFSSSSKMNFYLIPFFAFIGWGPITNLFKKLVPEEQIPTKFIEKTFYLSQSRLSEAAIWSGSVLHWFFAPPTGLSIFSFLITIYLLYKLYKGSQNKNLIYTTGLLISSFVIVDISKFAIIITCIVGYLFATYQPACNETKGNADKTTQVKLLKSAASILGIAIISGFIYGNYLRFDKFLIPLFDYYKLGTNSLKNDFTPLSSNIVLVILYSLGFYQAYKQKNEWLMFIVPFFALSLILPFFLTAPYAGVGKIFMISNIIGAFSAPLALDFLIKRFKLSQNGLRGFYTGIFLIFGFSSIMFFVFGEKEKPIFSPHNGFVKYNGFQSFPKYTIGEQEKPFISYLNSKFVKNKIIILDSQYADVFTKNTGLLTLLPVHNLEGIPVRKDAFRQADISYRSMFLANKKIYKDQGINWIFLTPKIFRYMFLPQARIKLLNSFILTGGLKLAVPAHNTTNLLSLSELYNITPSLISNKQSISYSSKLKKFLGDEENKKSYGYIYQIAECPYWGIYSALSNDFDGDKIADIAFFNPIAKKWHIVNVNNKEEKTINLSSSLLANSTDEDLLIPIPSDYDGDGKTDVGLFNKLKGTWHVLRSSDSRIDLRLLNTPWSIPVGEVPTPADIDGDSKTDQSCFDSVNGGGWHSSLSTTNTYQHNGFEFTVNDIPSHVDIDGDKKADYIIYRNSKKMFEAFLSSYDFNSQKRVQVLIGEENSRSVPADYDGDGKVDLATWTSSNGIWEIAYAKDFINKISSMVPAQPFIGCGVPSQNINQISCISHKLTLGAPGDIPIPADYNGDGKADIAVYHTFTAQLEIVMPSGIRKNIDLSKYKNYVLASFIGV